MHVLNQFPTTDFVCRNFGSLFSAACETPDLRADIQEYAPPRVLVSTQDPNIGIFGQVHFLSNVKNVNELRLCKIDSEVALHVNTRA